MEYSYTKTAGGNMNTLCECKELTHIKVAADIGADPFWCAKCGFNLDMDAFELPDAFKQELIDWVHNYGTWIDWESAELIEGGKAIETQHNALGLLLTERIIKKWIGKYKITFSPSHYHKKIESFT